MRYKTLSGYQFIIPLLLLSPLSHAAESEIDQLMDKKTHIDAETATVRQSSRAEIERLEQLRQKIAELYQESQNLDAAIKAESEKTMGANGE